MSVLENREETVRLFIRALMSGHIRINRVGLIGQKTDEHERYLHVLNRKIREFQIKPESDNIDFIFNAIPRLRVFGFLEGTLVDYEDQIIELEHKIEDLKNQLKYAGLEKKKLKEENIKLAEELKDREHAISMYEGKFLKGDSNDSKV